MTKQDWLDLIQRIEDIGLRVTSVDTATGTLTVKVPV